MLIDGIQLQIFEYRQNRNVFQNCRSFHFYYFPYNQQEPCIAAHHLSVDTSWERNSQKQHTVNVTHRHSMQKQQESLSSKIKYFPHSGQLVIIMLIVIFSPHRKRYLLMRKKIVNGERIRNPHRKKGKGKGKYVGPTRLSHVTRYANLSVYLPKKHI